MNISTEDLIERGFAPQSGIVDVLLIFPPTSVSRRYGKADLGDLGGDLIPLGIASIAAFLREKGYGVGVLDCCALGLTDEEIIAVLNDKKPRIIGLSSTTYALPSAVELAKKIRNALPNQLIILGGSHANVAGRETIDEYSVFDLVAVGADGEYTALEIVNTFAKCNYSRSEFLENHDKNIQISLSW